MVSSHKNIYTFAGEMYSKRQKEARLDGTESEQVRDVRLTAGDRRSER